MFCHSLRIKYMWKPMWNPMWSVWGFTCESLCETPCEVYVKICVKGMTSLHTLFTYISLCRISHAREICVWNAREKCVKNVWKMCEKSVKIGHFSHVFHMVFHIHTPSSVRIWRWCCNSQSWCCPNLTFFIPLRIYINSSLLYLPCGKWWQCLWKTTAGDLNYTQQ